MVEWVEMNSGMMVIIPRKGIVECLIKILNEEEFNKDIGDQDIINRYFDWKNKKLAISEIYNMYYILIDLYIEYFGFQKDDFKIIHFIGNIKPWMYNKDDLLKYRFSCQLANKKYELEYFNKYYNLINEIKIIDNI